MSPTAVQLSKRELLYALRYDCVTFFAFFLGEELTLEVPEFHASIWGDLLEMVEQANQEGVIIQLQKLFAVPRGFAKTTVAKLAVILLLKYTRMRFVLYASKTQGHGKAAIRDILGWLASDQYKELHGTLMVVKSNEGEGLWIIDLPIRDYESLEVKWKRCVFKALGASTHVRGTNHLSLRPQIVVVDDIEDNDNTTADLQPKLDEWFMGAFWKAFDSSLHVVIFIGNMIRETTILARLSKDPEWHPTVFGAIVRDAESGEIRSLWEAKFPLAGLLKEYRNFRKLGTGHVWEAEVMNLTQDEIFKADMDAAVRPPMPDVDELESGMLILDPAQGTHSWNDSTAITVHARITGLGIPCVIDSFVGHLTEDQIFDKMLELSYTWGINTWVIETELAQTLYIPLFKLLMKDRGLRVEAFCLLGLKHNKAVKSSRIFAMRSAVSKGSYAISENLDDLCDALLAYKENQKHDDYEDSASMGLAAWTSFGTTVAANGIQQQLFRLAIRNSDESPNEIQSGVEVAPW